MEIEDVPCWTNPDELARSMSTRAFMAAIILLRLDVNRVETAVELADMLIKALNKDLEKPAKLGDRDDAA